MSDKQNLHVTHRCIFGRENICQITIFQDLKKGYQNPVFHYYSDVSIFTLDPPIQCCSEHGSPEVSLGLTSWELVQNFVIFNT